MVGRISRLLVLPLALAAAGCNNPVEEEDHAQGLVVVDAQGTEVARHTVAAGTTGEIDIAVDATQTYTVHAVGEDGGRITIDGGELSLSLVDPTAGWTMTIQNENQLVLGASAAGTTVVFLELSHDGHAELRSEFVVTAG